MVLNIIFSYNRAMQLDYLIKSVIARFKIDYKLIVIYHTSGEHKKGYDLLKEKYAAFNNISFSERKKVLFDPAYINTFRSKEYRDFFLERNFMKKNSDNFKGLVQKEIKKSNCEFAMFNTDDGVFLEDIVIPEKVFEIIRKNPENASYRMYVGGNLDGHPSFVQKKEGYYEWDYYADKEIHHWTYPFSVDGTIYHSKGLLKHLKKIAYHNPVTLEENGFQYMRKKKLMKIGLSPIHSQLLLTKLNRVTVDTLNPTIHIKPEFLNEKFVDGYRLELSIPKIIHNCNIVPEEISLVKGDIRELIYKMDDAGKKVQSLLGIEGAKEQLR